MQTKSYIPAFTMMDIMTGMVIMSIVITMVFYLMSATNKQSFNYQAIRIQLNDYMLLKADLKRKTEAANRIESLPNGFMLVSEAESISYLKSDRYLIRQSEKSSDTLSHHISELTLIPVEASDLQPLVLNPLIATVILKIQFEDQFLFCYLYKDYGLTEPINQFLLREF